MEPGSDRERQRAALTDLERLRNEGDVLGGLFWRTHQYFGAGDAPAGDRTEIWGRRIGRSLSAIAFIALAVYLFATYAR